VFGHIGIHLGYRYADATVVAPCKRFASERVRMLDGGSSTFALGPFCLFAVERRLGKDGETVRPGGAGILHEPLKLLIY
jgi:hypothetical protein